jgi:hypothetical protein
MSVDSFGDPAAADPETELADAGRAEEDQIVFAGDEVKGAEVGDGVAVEAASVVEVELQTISAETSWPR